MVRRLVLVSASPRRKELLASLKIPFDVHPSTATEHWYGIDGTSVAQINARMKVERSQYFGDRSSILMGADTIIWFESQPLGKPFGPQAARRMLRRLSGRTHTVITGVCMSGCANDGARDPITVVSSTSSEVRFRVLTDKEIMAYIESKEWQGKAGAYAIQGLGGSLVQAVRGDYQNVVGLPLNTVSQIVEKHFGQVCFR